MEKKSIVVVTSIIKNEHGEILLSLRSDPKFPGAHLKRDLPGGKNEFGENLEETIIREVKEETGLDIDIQEMIPTHVFNLRKTEDIHQHTLVFCYKSRLIGGDLLCNDPKIKELRRVSIEEISKYDLLVGVEKMLSFL